eukprot:scaffold98131_cov57-Phaeocystis_antarctica.AAC.1
MWRRPENMWRGPERPLASPRAQSAERPAASRAQRTEPTPLPARGANVGWLVTIARETWRAAALGPSVDSHTPAQLLATRRCKLGRLSVLNVSPPQPDHLRRLQLIHRVQSRGDQRGACDHRIPVLWRAVQLLGGDRLGIHLLPGRCDRGPARVRLHRRLLGKAARAPAHDGDVYPGSSRLGLCGAGEFGPGIDLRLPHHHPLLPRRRRRRRLPAQRHHRLRVLRDQRPRPQRLACLLDARRGQPARASGRMGAAA